jgi:hypothetical protein
MLARRFLWIVAALTVLAVLAAIAWRIWGQELMRMAMVPRVAFEEAPAAAPDAYDAPDMWLARPGLPNDAGQWLPSGFTPEDRRVQASVFFIHPTSYLTPSRWNAPLDDEESQRRARLFVQSQASVFNGVADIWAPKYRQAAFGAFLTSKKEAQKALALAYRDVIDAFESFLEQAPKDRPIILAGHSQGSMHLSRLLAERIAGSPEQSRIAAAYVIGWPLSVTADLPELGIPACERAEQSGCIVSWQSFGEPADPGLVTQAYDGTFGPGGEPRAGSPMLCVNPLTGNAGDEAGREANLGTLIPNGTLTEGELRRPGVPARCDIRGFLLIGKDAPNLGDYVLPGNNFHVYDYALFWANARADAERRLTNFNTQ